MTFLDFLFAVLALLIIVLVIKLIIMIFKHPLFGRVMGLIAAVIGFIIGLNFPSLVEPGSTESLAIIEGALLLSIIYTVSYLCALGADSDAFDTYWDGTYSLIITDKEISLRENISGGFAAQVGGSLIIQGILSILALSSMPFLLWLIPIILALVNIGLVIKVIIDR